MVIIVQGDRAGEMRAHAHAPKSGQVRRSCWTGLEASIKGRSGQIQLPMRVVTVSIFALQVVCSMTRTQLLSTHARMCARTHARAHTYLAPVLRQVVNRDVPVEKGVVKVQRGRVCIACFQAPLLFSLTAGVRTGVLCAIDLWGAEWPLLREEGRREGDSVCVYVCV
jgi:hypothetical protein